MYDPYPYGDPFAGFRKLLREANKPVAHQETCPECGRTLVNVYRRGKVWKCRRCWEAQDAEEEKATHGQEERILAKAEDQD